MTDWNKETRTAVEAAAAQGDESAASALRLHVALDRVEAQLVSTEAEMRQGFDALKQDIRALAARTKKKQEKS